MLMVVKVAVGSIPSLYLWLLAVAQQMEFQAFLNLL